MSGDHGLLRAGQVWSFGGDYGGGLPGGGIVHFGGVGGGAFYVGACAFGSERIRWQNNKFISVTPAKVFVEVSE
jgi:hypothetical protein